LFPPQRRRGARSKIGSPGQGEIAAWGKMNGQEFYEELRKNGLNENDIKGLYTTYLKIKENDKDLTLDEWFNRAVQAHEEIKKEPAGVLTF